MFGIDFVLFKFVKECLILKNVSGELDNNVGNDIDLEFFVSDDSILSSN